jgi:hypothetical protein
MRPIPASEIIGKRFGRLVPTVELERVGGLRQFRCDCECGGSIDVRLNALRKGATSSCGCYRREVAAATTAARAVHGECHKTPEHRSWQAMIARCTQPSHVAYERYAGRGITICDRWRGQGGYENFLADMGRRPSLDYTLDRVDNDGNYTPENCRWADRSTQIRNQRPRLKPA